MAKNEMDTAMGDQEEKISPSEEDTPSVLNETSAPLNFCEMAPSDFGICLKSFTPASSLNHKGGYLLPRQPLVETMRQVVYNIYTTEVQESPTNAFSHVQ